MNVVGDSIPVEDLIGEIQEAIKVANVSTEAASDLMIQSAHLVLNAVAVGGGGGKVDFRIPVIGMKLSLGAKASRQDTHTIDVTLVPPPPDEHEVRSGGVSRVLVNAIATIRRIMRRAAVGPDPLALQTSSVEISFAVTREGAISIGFDGELRDEVTHTVRLALGPPKPIDN